jgi:hypothetical protein
VAVAETAGSAEEATETGGTSRFHNASPTTGHLGPL